MDNGVLGLSSPSVGLLRHEQLTLVYTYGRVFAFYEDFCYHSR